VCDLRAGISDLALKITFVTRFCNVFAPKIGIFHPFCVLRARIARKMRAKSAISDTPH
jgi:hypothetical protein